MKAPIVKKFVVFRLHENPFQQFTLENQLILPCDTIAESEESVLKVMREYRERNIENIRFVVQEVYFFDDDEMFSR